MLLNLKLTRLEFDSAKIVQQAAKRAKTALNKAGAFVRRRTRSSMRRRKKSSPAGQPPSAHAGNLKTILFEYDPTSQSMFVGPTIFRGKSVESSSAGTGAALQEFGGRARLRTTKRQRGVKIVESKPASFAPHPFMQPALQAEMPKFPSLWSSGV